MKLIYADDILHFCEPFLEDGDDYVENTANDIIEFVTNLPTVDAIPVGFIKSYALRSGTPLLPFIHLIDEWRRHNGQQ